MAQSKQEAQRKSKAGEIVVAKQKQLESFSQATENLLTTNQGVVIPDNHNSLKAGVRGPTLLEDFILREKITHFDHERIPERIVHARGAGAHGYFELARSLVEYTRADFLQEAGARTPVFVRFSTVAGSRGSADTVRDVRGFAVKFYTREGNYDLVGNNIPVFFIQDAMKFPDLVHALKPEPHHEMPQAASAHDTFWDFVSLMPESTHMLMWIMSDRAIPRSFRMMEGFGVHTFRFINAKGVSHFVKFHWKPKLGKHSLVWDEAQKTRGQGPGLSPARPVGIDRAGQLSRVGTGRAAGRGRQGVQPGLRPAGPDQADPRGDGAGAGRGQAGPEPQPRQFFRGNRAGRLPSRPCRAGHRFQQRPAAAGTPVLVHRHAAVASGRAELPRDPDQPRGRARSTISSATACTAC